MRVACWYFLTHVLIDLLVCFHRTTPIIYQMLQDWSSMIFSHDGSNETMNLIGAVKPPANLSSDLCALEDLCGTM